MVSAAMAADPLKAVAAISAAPAEMLAILFKRIVSPFRKSG
jgi:hypothetical protein